MKKYRIHYLLCCIVFFFFLLIPIFWMDFVGGTRSETENRNLAPFPIVVDSKKHKINVKPLSVENWLNDNIGFRQLFMNIYATTKLKFFGLSASEKVLIGREGWFYYTYDNNIEIATGEYPLSSEELQLIAKNQQDITNYYNSLGIDYILMLTPSKVSVYPEYLPMRDEVIQKTPVDVLTDYLRQHTNVKIYNSKDYLLEAKTTGQLYHKTDTHWNQRGSYYVYKGLVDMMDSFHILNDFPINVSFEDGKYKGEFSKMLGSPNLLEEENTPIATWKENFTKVEEGVFYKRIQEAQRQVDPTYLYACGFWENKTVRPNILQIYGDSQLMDSRKIPQYLSEHFSQVINYRIRNVSIQVDAVAQPDVVLFSCSERYINSLLTVPGDIPKIVDAIPEIEKSTVQKKGYQGMWLDQVNGKKVMEQGAIKIENSDNKVTTLVGWAVDFSTMKPLSKLYLKVGERILECDYGIERKRVSKHFQDENLRMSGFKVVFPDEYLMDLTDPKLEFIQVAADSEYSYEPVAYRLTE